MKFIWISLLITIIIMWKFIILILNSIINCNKTFNWVTVKQYVRIWIHVEKKNVTDENPGTWACIENGKRYKMKRKVEDTQSKGEFNWRGRQSELSFRFTKRTLIIVMKEKPRNNQQHLHTLSFLFFSFLSLSLSLFQRLLNTIVTSPLF